MKWLQSVEVFPFFPSGVTLRLLLIPVHILCKLGTEVHKVTAATVKQIKK